MASAANDAPSHEARSAKTAMIGTLQLARLYAGDPQSDQILAAGRKAALALLEGA